MADYTIYMHQFSTYFYQSVSYIINLQHSLLVGLLRSQLASHGACCSDTEILWNVLLSLVQLFGSRTSLFVMDCESTSDGFAHNANTCELRGSRTCHLSNAEFHQLFLEPLDVLEELSLVLLTEFIGLNLHLKCRIEMNRRVTLVLIVHSIFRPSSTRPPTQNAPILLPLRRLNHHCLIGDAEN